MNLELTPLKLFQRIVNKDTYALEDQKLLSLPMELKEKSAIQENTVLKEQQQCKIVQEDLTNQDKEHSLQHVRFVQPVIHVQLDQLNQHLAQLKTIVQQMLLLLLSALLEDIMMIKLILKLQTSAKNVQQGSIAQMEKLKEDVQQVVSVILELHLQQILTNHDLQDFTALLMIQQSDLL